MKHITNKINYIIAFVLISFTVTSCLLDDTVTDFGKGPIITQFSAKEATGNFLQDGTNAVYEYLIPIEYQGADGIPLNEAVTITIAVDPNSEATEGVEFTLSQTEFTIPAGERFANAMISVNSEFLDALDPKVAIIAITASSQTISDNFKTEVTLQAICPSNLEGEYVNQAYGDPTTITSTGPGTYSISRGNYFNSAYPLNITDVCGNLTIKGGFLEDNYGIVQSGQGSVDPDTGTISLVYTAEGYFENRPLVLIKQ